MKLKQTPLQWKTENSHRFDEIRKILAEIPPKQSEKSLDEILLDRIWHACACAATYERDSDRHYLERKEQARQHSRGKAKVQSAISKVRESMHEIPALAQVACKDAKRNLAVRGIDLKLSGPMPFTEIFDTILEELHSALEDRAIGWRGGAFLHSTHDGCLGYPGSIEGIPNLAKKDTMLLFAVVLYFRKHSMGVSAINGSRPLLPNEDIGIQMEEPMPSAGESRYNLAYKIVQIAVPDSSIHNDVDARGRLAPVLAANTGLTLVPWPHDQ